MAVHVAILLRPYINLILSGRKTVESRLTIMPRPPFNGVKAGERIYFRASAGPYMATAVAEAVEFYNDLTPAKIVALQKQWNGQVCGEAAYWQWKRKSRYATFVRLREVEATTTGPNLPPSNGIAWFTVSETTMPSSSFDVKLTNGAIRNGYVVVQPKTHRFPAGAYGDASKSAAYPVTLELPGGEAATTDVIKGPNRLRWRGWRQHFERENLRAGDVVRFTPIDGKYRVAFVKSDPSRDRGTIPATSTTAERPVQTDASSAPGPSLFDFISRPRLKAIIKDARREDLGPRNVDLTSELLIPAGETATARVRSRQRGRLSGAALLPFVAAAYDPAVKIAPHLNDGAALEPGDVVAEISGPLRSVLGIERVALNFLTLLSGIASQTALYAAETAGTKARIYDTRKTHPGLRELEKYAVVCGGGHSHRMGLYDAVLVKDNHIAHIPKAKLRRAVAEMLEKARHRKPAPKFVMVEVDTLTQLEAVLAAGPDIVLLDNMTIETIRQAVAMRDKVAPQVELEISGGVRLETVKAFAQTGVDRISAGAITHSAPALDLGLDIE